MSQATATTYDEVPYESNPFAQTHPGRLATVATLLGLSPPPVDRCRLLELGCASGGNLIPMAAGLAASEFVGIDLSGRQVAQGQRIVSEVGLRNITLLAVNILDVAPEIGTFDYIICHGVYSWVGPDVRDHILALCARHLAPNGIAYVSYNTYPGWHMRGTIREMMLYHATRFQDPPTRVRQARALLDFLAESVGQENSPYHHLLQAELNILRQTPDSYLFHEHLEEHNDPVYFFQFVRQAESKGLRYLAEADLNVMAPGNFRPEIQEVLQQLSDDLIHLEQYMDFLRNRMFRQTLLCHAQHTPQYKLQPRQLSAFHVASALRPASAAPSLRNHQPEVFQAANGASVRVTEPLFKAVLSRLADRWPETIPFPALCAEGRALLDGVTIRETGSADRDAEQIGAWLLHLYTSAAGRLVELHVRPPICTRTVSERPRACAYTRWQARAGRLVTNLRHEPVELTDFARHLIQLLDGEHDRGMCCAALMEMAETQRLAVSKDGEPVRDRQRLRLLFEEALDGQLPLMARQSLLLS
jgi:methyltransferase-like protein/2-polyprenyl-3-methyl-5-hydroxy-6-metoxy-1,4-benzoquinol methylase